MTQDEFIAAIRAAHEEHLRTGEYGPLGIAAQDALREYDRANNPETPQHDIADIRRRWRAGEHVTAAELRALAAT